MEGTFRVKGVHPQNVVFEYRLRVVTTVHPPSGTPLDTRSCEAMFLGQGLGLLTNFGVRAL